MCVVMKATHQNGKLLRYALSGSIAAVIYMGSTAGANRTWDLDLSISSALGYLVAMPCAYLLHRHVSFASKQPVPVEATKFIQQSVLSILFAAILPRMMYAAGLPLFAALGITSVAVPLINYLMLSLWVFRTR